MNRKFDHQTSSKRSLWIRHIFIILILFPILGNATICENLPPALTDWESLMKHEGEYHNCNYGYSALIPEGLVGRSSPPPNPQHGFGILLSRQPKGYLWVDGSYNSLEWESLEQAANQHIEWIKEDVHILSVQKHQTTLQEIPALRLIVHCECSDGIMVNDYILAIDERQIVYTIGLSAGKGKYEEYKSILDDISATWRFIKLPCEQD